MLLAINHQIRAPKHLRKIFSISAQERWLHRHTFLFGVREAYGREFGIRHLLLLHGDEGRKPEHSERSCHERVADAVHRGVDKLNWGLRIERPVPGRETVI